MKKTREEKAITLIALIITIVVLLILAVVAINAITGDGIIQHAVNAKEDYQKATDDEEAMLQNYLVVLNKKTITWTKTSTGDLSIGSTVKTNTDEEFYVIGFKDNNEIAILLAKNNLKADGSAQDTGERNPCAFSTVKNLSFASGENLNNNSTIKADTTSAVYKAMKYGETLGVTTGRLMLNSEAEDLDNDEYSDILYGRNEKSSGEYLTYWLGSAFNTYNVWFVNGHGSRLSNIGYDVDIGCGVRPVVEILKNDIK